MRMPLTSGVLWFSVWLVLACALETVVVQPDTILCEVLWSHILGVVCHEQPCQIFCHFWCLVVSWCYDKVIALFQTWMTGSSESSWDHMAIKLSVPLCWCWAHTFGSVTLWLSLTIWCGIVYCVCTNRAPLHLGWHSTTAAGLYKYIFTGLYKNILCLAHSWCWLHLTFGMLPTTLCGVWCQRVRRWHSFCVLWNEALHQLFNAFCAFEKCY